MTDLYDVIAVNIKTGAKRSLATDETERSAEAVIKMAVMRLGVKEEFYMAIPIRERATAIREGRDALRWLLNISDPSDEPDTRVGSLMDETFNSSGQTTRQSLERLWEALKAEFTDDD